MQSQTKFPNQTPAVKIAANCYDNTAIGIPAGSILGCGRMPFCLTKQASVEPLSTKIAGAAHPKYRGDVMTCRHTQPGTLILAVALVIALRRQ
jgi:hypothetical protein